MCMIIRDLKRKSSQIHVTHKNQKLFEIYCRWCLMWQIGGLEVHEKYISSLFFKAHSQIKKSWNRILRCVTKAWKMCVEKFFFEVFKRFMTLWMKKLFSFLLYSQFHHIQEPLNLNISIYNIKSQWRKDFIWEKNLVLCVSCKHQKKVIMKEICDINLMEISRT